ncbi:hypothetical protein D3C78_1859120 [compost metagenome]
MAFARSRRASLRDGSRLVRVMVETRPSALRTVKGTTARSFQSKPKFMPDFEA